MLLTTPLIRALRRRFPQARLEYLTGRWSAPAIASNPHLNNVTAFDDAIIQSRNIPRLLGLAAKIRRQKYDTILVLDPGWQAGLLSAFFGGLRVGFDRNGEGKFHHRTTPLHRTQHDSEQYLVLGGLLGAHAQDTSLDFFVPAADTTFAQIKVGSVPRPRVALCPGGGKNPYQSMPARRWPASYYRRLAQMLESAGVSIVICGSREDEGIAKTVATPKSLNLTGRTNLGQTAAALAACNAVVTHDQGLLHVAAAAKTPIVALFGPTDPRRKRPLGEKHRVIWHANEPCEHSGKLYRCGPAHDMHAISIAEVFTAVRDMLVSSANISSTAPITSSADIART